LAPPAARDLVDGLSREPAPLIRALARLPAVGLHGDLKLANVALRADGDVGLIDWQLTMRAPIAVELGWFLVSNSGSLPEPPEPVLNAYRAALGQELRDRGPERQVAVVGDWSAQADLAWIVGLLLRGWRKGLDAEAGVRLPSGVSAADDLAWWCERAVKAGERRL
jgi:aminoglycoside phosphotransferase (APT) family kinase protein